MTERERERTAERRIDDLLERQSESIEQLYKLLNRQIEIADNLSTAIRENTDSFAQFLDSIKTNTGKLEAVLIKLNGIRPQNGSRISIPSWLFYGLVLALLAAVGVDAARLLGLVKP